VAAGFVDVTSQLARVERDIERVEVEVASVGKKLAPLEEKDESNRLTERDEKRLDALRKEKEQLRKEKEQLREERLILLRGPSEALVPAFQRLSLTAHLPHQLGLVSPRARSVEPEQVNLQFQDFELRDKGPTLSLSCVRGADFLREAEKLVRDNVSDIAPSMVVSFCIYQTGVEGRIVFREYWAFWDKKPSSCIYYWCGEKPPSPTKMIAELKQGQKRVEEEQIRLRDDLQRARLVSTTQAIQDEFDKRVGWKISDLEEWLTGDVKIIDIAPMSWSKYESVVQGWWVETLRSFPNVKDTHAHCRLLGHDGTLHKPDLTMIVGPSVLWEKVDRVIELKPSITSPAETRDVVVQLYTRMIEILDHQPQRVVVYGAALDHGNACFIRVERKLERPLERKLYVSDCLELFEGTRWSVHGELLLRFLKLSAEACGFVEVKLPMVLNVQMESVLCRRRNSAVYLAQNVVYKTSSTFLMEAEIMKRLAECRPPVCPRLLSDVSCDSSSFAMEFGMDSRGVEGLDLKQLTGDLFWAVFQLHEQKIVHCDIKPSNVVFLNGAYCFIDFDAAVELRDGVERRRMTEAFSSSPLVKEESCADWDMVGVFWTVTFFHARASTGSAWRNSCWDAKLRYQWGLEMIVSSASLLRRVGMVPESGTAPCRLVHPKEHMMAYCQLKEGCRDRNAWIERVRELEKGKNWPSCPELILERKWN
jgi:tRNA A-37 threonylcarbamoyl transferase component Bud32/predicted Holliday junction resolvase-like endonuclease